MRKGVDDPSGGEITMTFVMHLKRPCGCILWEEIQVKDEAEVQVIFERLLKEPCEECVEKMLAPMIHRETANC